MSRLPLNAHSGATVGQTYRRHAWCPARKNRVAPSGKNWLRYDFGIDFNGVPQTFHEQGEFGVAFVPEMRTRPMNGATRWPRS